MSDKWERPPPKLVRGKSYFIYFIIGLFLGGLIVFWLVGGLIGFLLFLIIIVSIVIVSVWWVITSLFPPRAPSTTAHQPAG